MTEKVNLRQKLETFNETWTPKIVGQINHTDVKLAKVDGEFHWHHHDHEDEMFYVIKGTLRMLFRDKEVVINEGEFIIVPHGIEHKPVADEECHIMLIEPHSTLNTGNIINERTVSKPDII